VEFPAPEAVSAIALSVGYPHREFGRNLILDVWGAEGRRRVAYADGPAERRATLEELLARPRGARMVLRIPKETITAFRLRVGFREHEDAWPRWRVPELRVYRDCR
jgi:hypothetical protein